MQITVTKDDIRKGRRRSGFYCAVTLAIKRGTQTSSACVGHDGVRVGFLFRGQLQPNVRAWIWRYDWLPHCWPFVQPFTFDLDL